MIVGSWILLLQVVGVYLRVDVVASMHALPEKRVKSMRSELIYPHTTIMVAHILSHFDSHDLPDFQQFGFRPERSTVLQLIDAQFMWLTDFYGAH